MVLLAIVVHKHDIRHTRDDSSSVVPELQPRLGWIEGNDITRRTNHRRLTWL